MLNPIKVVDIELSQPIATLEGLDGYRLVQGLVRLHGTPIGYIEVPIVAGRCESSSIAQSVLEQHHQSVIQQLLTKGLAAVPPAGLRIEELLDLPVPPPQHELPLVTVAVCTRDRTPDLEICLNYLCNLNYPNLDLLVIDNAPSNDATERLVQKYSQVRYVCEPRPGLDWARNRAILEAQGEIIAYTDDDVVVDGGWVEAIARVFAENPEVMAVTGLVVPYELETEAQVLFELYGGFGRGFDRQWYRVEKGNKLPWQLLGTGQFGTGANMAYRRAVFHEIGCFDPALDVGTVTNGGGDLEMFFRIVKGGHTLVYEPEAIVRHRHRRDYVKLKTQIKNNGSLYSYFVRSALAYADQRLEFLYLGIFWMAYWNIRRLISSLVHPSRFPRDLILAELWGGFVGLTRYQKARKVAAEVAATLGNLPSIAAPELATALPSKFFQGTAVRTVELAEPLAALTDVEGYWSSKIFVTWRQAPLGSFDIVNQYQPIALTRLKDAIVKNLGFKLLTLGQGASEKLLESEAIDTLTRRFLPSKPVEVRLDADVLVSIIVGTCDRPDDLRNCLASLVAQDSPRSLEIVVVDNRPASGLTPPVVAEFPSVVLVSEPRQGVAYARNAGIAASRGDIVVTTDDDVTIQAQWLENLLAPFARADVMAVTGNVLPLELNTRSQHLFEQYGDGGLGRGFDRFEADGRWFEWSILRTVPTWELGGTANSAFRSCLFHDPKVGLMEETLGPGMPSGVGEDIYLFYKILKADYRIVYEPSACVWHKHRQDMAGLSHQLYNYSKGFVSYQLTTLLHDRDFRSLFSLFVVLPLYHLKRMIRWLAGDRSYPLPLIWTEISGNLAGAWSLWRSYQRVWQQGRSTPYLPVKQRLNRLQQATEERIPTLTSP